MKEIQSRVYHIELQFAHSFLETIKTKDENVMYKKIDYTFSDFKLLIVDDDKVTIAVVRLFLKDTCIIQEAYDAETAIKLVKETNYDLILLDIKLGRGKNGLEVLKEIREISGYKDTPIAALTAYAMVGDKEKLLAAGFTYYISKPFSKGNLLKLLESVTGKG